MSNETKDGKRIVVLYGSSYGYTEQYARFLSQALDCDCIESRNIKAKQLALYDTVIFGGGLYAGSLGGSRFLTKNAALLAQKRLIVFTCGLANPLQDSVRSSICKTLEHILPQTVRQSASVFFLRGGIDYSRLSFLHRIMMYIMYRMIIKKPQGSHTNEDREFIVTYGGHCDFTDRSTIDPIVKCALGQ